MLALPSIPWTLRPVAVSITNCNSPLVWDATMLDAMKVYATHNQPLILAPFALCGASTTASGVCMSGMSGEGSLIPPRLRTLMQPRRFLFLGYALRDWNLRVLLHTLEDRQIYVSAGSACSSHKRAGSPTLTAIGASKAEMESAVRFSFSEFTTLEQIDYTLDTLREVLPMLRRFTRK